MAATNQSSAQFGQDGFAVLGGLFSEAEIKPISDEVDRIVSGKASYMPATELIFEPGSEPPRLRNAFRMHRYHDLFLEAAAHPRIVRVVEEILGKPLRLYGSQIFAKPSLVGTAVPQHQDMPYWPFAPPELVSAWIALDDSTLENGCVRFSVGSHKLGMLPHAPSGVAGNSLGLAPNPDVAALEERAVEVRRGSCVLHHALTVHRSGENRSPLARRSLIYIYMSPNVQVTDAGRLKGGTDFPVVG